MVLGLEDYGYPKVDFMGNGYIRVVHGWFFWDYDDEYIPATYFETWVRKDGQISIILSDPTIFFDFITPLDDYTMPAYEKWTIGEAFPYPKWWPLYKVLVWLECQWKWMFRKYAK